MRLAIIHSRNYHQLNLPHHELVVVASLLIASGLRFFILVAHRQANHFQRHFGIVQAIKLYAAAKLVS